MVKLVNLTPHPVNIVDEDGNFLVTVDPSGQAARCSEQREVVDVLDVEGAKVPLNRTFFGEVCGLPDPELETLFVVSRAVAQAVSRTDLVIPDETVRDDEGRIIGCKALARPE